MCGPLLGGFWWIFPLVGFLLCLGFMLTGFRSARTGRGCMCMGGHRGRPNDALAETRGESGTPSR